MTETPREFYLRAVVKDGALEIVMGLEFDPGAEDIAQLRDEMKRLARQVVIETAAEHTEGEDVDAMLACELSGAMGKAWPGRRYFLEVQHDDPDEGWVQVITPSGWPPKKADAGERKFCHCHGYTVEVCPNPLRREKESPPVLTEEMAVKLANEGAEDFWEYRKRMERMWRKEP